MAFSAISSPNPTSLQLLLDEIKFQQHKELQLASVSGQWKEIYFISTNWLTSRVNLIELNSCNIDSSGFLSRGTTYWTDVFVRHFLFQCDRSIDADDLLFFVRKKHVRGNVTLPKFLV